MPDDDLFALPPDLCHRCWEPDCPGTCGYPVKEPPSPEPEKPDITRFPYFDVCKVRNMFFALDIPVFTSTAEQADQVVDGYVRFKHIYCCN